MRKCFAVGIELAIIGFITISLLSNPPLWKKTETAPAASSPHAMVQDR